MLDILWRIVHDSQLITSSDVSTHLWPLEFPVGWIFAETLAGAISESQMKLDVTSGF